MEPESYYIQTKNNNNRIDQINCRGLKIQHNDAVESFLDECLRFQQ